MAYNYTAYSLFSTESYWRENTSDANEFIVGNYTGGLVTKGAMRFSNVTIPQGTTIIAAELFIWVGSKAGTNIKIKLHGIDEDNTAAFSSSPFGRAETTDFSLLDDTIPSTGQWRTIGAVSPIQEVINRAGWTSGNALGFIVRDNGSAADSWILDTQANQKSKLFIRIAALPNFTPASTSLAPPIFPVDSKYGIKIAVTNVLKEVSKKLFFNSNQKEPKILKQGKSEGEAIFHTVSYIPMGIGWYEDTDGTKHIATARLVSANSDFSSISSFQGTLYITDNYLSLSPATGKKAYYYIFIDPLLT
mgnify:CR=1 FL=1